MLLLLLLACSVAGFAAAVSADTSIYFDPADGEVSACSDTIYCTEIWIGPVDDIKGYSIEITFRSADLNLIDIVEGDVFSSAGHMSTFFDLVRPGAVEDTIAVDASDLTGSVSGPGHLLTICFGRPWVCVDGSPLSIVAADVRDSSNGPIPVVPANATVSVTCPTPTDETTWGAVKGLYR